MTALAIARCVTSNEVFHVHADGCADLHRNRRYSADEIERGDWADVEALVRDYYSGHMHDNGDDNWQQYQSEFRVFPCVQWRTATFVVAGLDLPAGMTRPNTKGIPE